MEKLITRKKGMTQIWNGDEAIPVTVLEYAAGEESAALAASLAEGGLVRVSGTSKGRGFQGVVKRHGFGGGPKTHGQKDRLRAPGSLGPTAPQRVLPGRKMAGRMGNVRVTVRNLTVAKLDAGRNLIMVRGAVPGVRGGKIEIRSAK